MENDIKRKKTEGSLTRRTECTFSKLILASAHILVSLIRFMIHFSPCSAAMVEVVCSARVAAVGELEHADREDRGRSM